MKNLDRLPRQPYHPPPPPQIEDGKMARFALCAASSLIWSGLGLLFQFILPRLQS